MDDSLAARPVKGRGAVTNRSGRFEAETLEAVDDGWDLGLEDLPPLRTEVTAEWPKTIISRNTSPDIPYDRSINPYRGCEHGCVYCYARPSHAYMGLSPGLDFESRLFAKPNAAELLEQELSKPNYRPLHIHIGANTDPYQPIERTHEITRRVIEVLVRFNHPFSITTKSALIRRDLDILGPAAEKPYSPSRPEPQGWRNIRDYSGGKLTDWGAHLLDTAQVANFAELSGPIEVDGKGVIPPNAMNTVPATWNIKYTYGNDVIMHVTSSQPSIRFLGSDGWVGNTGWRGRLLGSDVDIFRKEYTPAENKIWPMPPTEHRNFLDCVRSRKMTTYHPEALHRLSTVMHLGAISMELGRKLKWNPEAEAFEDDAAANKLRSRESRDDWQTG